MEIFTASVWVLGATAVAWIIDRKGLLDWATDRIANRLRLSVLKGPLVFEPGDRLKAAKLERLD